MNAKSSQAVSDNASGTTIADDAASRHGRVRRSTAARSLAAAVAVLSWLGPVQISWQVARQNAAAIALRTASPFDAFAERLTSWRTTGHLLLRFELSQAEAAPITDPTAPIRFTPSLTQTTGTNGGCP
jgi:filamentous hemagglutinin